MAELSPANGPQLGDRVWIVDANNMVHRLYHARAPMTSPTGAPINAVVPGVRGIGPKTAAKILRERGSLETALDKAALIPGKLGLSLLAGRADARMSRRLVALQADTPLPLELDELRPWVPSRIALDDFFRELGYPRFESAVDPYKEPT